jgi:DNA-binding Lrp family transcriptional regulator
MKWNLAILAALQRDGRLSARELADNTGISRSAVWRRKTHLEEIGVILGYRAVVAPAYLSGEQDVIVFIVLGSDPRFEVQEFELRAMEVEDVVSLLRVGLNAYWVRIATRRGLMQLEKVARECGMPTAKFDVSPVLSEIIPYRDPPVRRAE